MVERRSPVHVRLAGRGGQGAMLAGLLLAEAGMEDGFRVVQTESYGPEARLGAAKSDVILSREEIAFPEVIEPDVLLCLSRDAYVAYGRDLAPGGFRLVDELVASELDVGESLVLPLARTAREVGDVLVANVVALGALVALRNLVSESALQRAIERRVKPEFVEVNTRALAAGLRLGKQAQRRAVST